MAKITATALCVVVLVVLVVSHEVEADSDCSRECNQECLDKQPDSKVTCSVQCFGKCSGMFNIIPIFGFDQINIQTRPTPEAASKLRDELQKQHGGETTPAVEAEFREILKHMMETPAAAAAAAAAPAAEAPSPSWKITLRGLGKIDGHA